MLRIDGFTLRQLRSLRALPETGSLTAAAQALRLSVPAVHSQLRSLELGLGADLVDRSRRGAHVLTPEGLAVLDAAHEVEAALQACAARVAAIQAGQEGRVVLGCVSTAKYVAPRLVAELKRLPPGIEVELRIGNREATVAALASRSVDIAVMGRPPREPRVVARALGPHPHLIIAAPGHPLADAGPVPANRLLDETFIAREEGSGTRILMMRYLDGLSDSASLRFIVMDTNETIKQAVLAGLGIAFISAHTVAEELRAGRLVALASQGLPIERTWFLVHREDLRVNAPLARVIATIEGLDGAYLPGRPQGR